jgi:MFS family permease
VALALFAVNTNFFVGLLLAYLLGVGFMFQFTLINTLLQTRVEDAMRGRVMSLYTLTLFGFSPFGNLLVGALSESIGLSTALLAMAAITLASAVMIFWKTPQMRHLP